MFQCSSLQYQPKKKTSFINKFGEEGKKVKIVITSVGDSDPKLLSMIQAFFKVIWYRIRENIIKQILSVSLWEEGEQLSLVNRDGVLGLIPVQVSNIPNG